MIWDIPFGLLWGALVPSWDLVSHGLAHSGTFLSRAVKIEELHHF